MGVFTSFQVINNDNNNNGTITEGLLKELEDLEIRGRVETIKTNALLRTARILRRVLESCCHLNFCENPSPNLDVKNSQRVNNINTIG